nr:hypothetical protein [Tanacetum cinerariifolium]
IIEDKWEKHEEVVVSYADLRASIKGYYEENVDHMDQTDKVIQETMNSFGKNNIVKGDLLNALNRVTETLKAIQDDVKEDLALNKKVVEATEAYRKNSIYLTSSAILPDLNALILVLYMMNGKLFYVTEEQTQPHLDKEDQIKKAEEESKRLAMTKTKVIKIVQDEAKKIGINPKKVICAKVGENFKTAQDAEMQSALLAHILEQASSQSSGRKRKHMELELEIKVPGMECNRSLPEGVPFVNNMVIEELEYGIFFTDMFGNMEMELDIDNMMMNEYWEYEAAKKGYYGIMFDPEEV